MVFAFLRAEVNAPRYAPTINAILAASGLSRIHLIDHGDVSNAEQNELRASVLERFRGYRAGTLLFGGFPKEVEWSYVELEPSDIRELRYASYPALVQLSGPSRRVQDAANRVANTDVGEGISENIRALGKILQGGARI